MYTYLETKSHVSNFQMVSSKREYVYVYTHIHHVVCIYQVYRNILNYWIISGWCTNIQHSVLSTCLYIWFILGDGGMRVYLGRICLYSGFTPGLTHGSLLEVLMEPHMVLGTEPRLAAWQASTLSTVLSLQPSYTYEMLHNKSELMLTSCLGIMQ